MDLWLCQCQWWTGYWEILGDHSDKQKKVDATQEKIIDLIKAQPYITRSELAKKISMSSDGVKYHLDNLKSAGIIQHVGSTKSGHWEILK